jgi:thiamine transport system substrate-binding protein
MKNLRALGALCALTALGLTASACSTIGEQSADDAATSDEVVLVTHDSFALPRRS